MKTYKILIAPQALQEINDIKEWYNHRQRNLGARFQKQAIRHINSLYKDPHIFTIRYNEIRCIPIKKFPYMIHYYINEDIKSIEVLAVLNTSRNPEIWKDNLRRK